MNQRHVRITLVAVIAFVIAGCSNYYKIHDPTTGKDYYTEDYDQRRDGSVTFIDSSSGNEVSIQNSEIEELDDEDDFEDGKKAAEAAPAAASQTP